MIGNDGKNDRDERGEASFFSRSVSKSLRSQAKRLVVVSNREPYINRKTRDGIRWDRPAGGVTVALDPLLQSVNGTWVAWGSGDADRQAVDERDRVRVPPDQPSYTLRRIWLMPEEVEQYYHGYSNRFLWPLCHMTLDRVVFRRKYWEAYRSVNERFAQVILEELDGRPGLVWIQDYHLALCPLFLKQHRPDLTVALFWHIPWPAHDVFRICPQRKELLSALLACDQIGFHLDRYRSSFLECVKQELGSASGPGKDRVLFRDHETKILAAPVSIDFESFEQRARSPETEKRMDNLRKRLKIGPESIVGLGVDRLDYTKGLLKRLWALEEFLARYPEYHGRFLFIQIAAPTRAESEPYRGYREILQSTVHEINRRFARPDWKPIEYIEGQLSHASVVAYYRLARFCLVSSVYDGMNLVSKEYAASKVDETGVLLLSEMAGSLDELEGAIPINPYDVEGTAEAIRKAIEMPAEEQRARMARMRESVRRRDIYEWMETNLNSISG
ncbi:MAG TPA: trehalose-6-phosphate synthase [Nitrospiria bacterium]